MNNLERAEQLYAEALGLNAESWCEGSYICLVSPGVGLFSQPVGQKGRDLMTEAAQLGLSCAQYQLGLFFLFEDDHRHKMEVDYETLCEMEQRLAVRWLKDAAQQSHGEAALVLGDLYSNRIKGISFLMANPAEAFSYYQIGAKVDAEAMCRTGECFFLGKGVPQDYTAAFNCFTNAQAQGCQSAWYYLGECYMNGYGTSVDTAKAINCFQKAIQINVGYKESSRLKLGFIYAGGNGADYANLDKARDFLQQIEANSNPAVYRAAQELLAQLSNSKAQQSKQQKKKGLFGRFF